MLAGTLAATDGQVFLQRQDVTSLPAYRRARLGLVRTFQRASEFKRLTVLENLLAAIPGHHGESFRGAMLGQRYWGAQERELIGRGADDARAFRPAWTGRSLRRRAQIEQLEPRHAGDYAGRRSD